MNRRFFDKSLYAEGLRRLKAPGIVLGSLVIFTSVLQACLYNANNTIDLSNKSYLDSTYYPTHSLGADSFACLLAWFSIIGGIAYIFRLFFYLSDRNASDLYDSLPVSRTALYTSYAMSTLTWLFATILATLLLTYAASALRGININAAYLPRLFFAYASAAVLISGAALFAVILSGRKSERFALVILILYWPWLLCVLFSLVVTTTTPAMQLEGFWAFFNPEYNLPMRLLSGTAYSYSFTSFSDIILNTGLIALNAAAGILLMLLGGLLYKRRTSELAGISIKSQTLLHIVSCLISLPFLFIAVFGYIDSNAQSPSSQPFITTIIALVLSLAAFFISECAISKKQRRFFRSAPFYLATVALAVIIVLLSGFARGSVLIVPEAKDVDSVLLNIDDPQSGNSDPHNVLYNDAQSIQTVLKDLKNNTLQVKSSGFHAYSWEDSSGIMACGITLKNGQTIKRRISFSQDELHQLQNQALSNTSYIRAQKSLPTLNEIHSIQIDGVDAQSCSEIYQTFCKEASGLSDRAFAAISHLRGYDSTDSSSVYYADLGNIRLERDTGTSQSSNQYEITELTPQTAGLYLKLIFQKQKASFQKKINRILHAVPAPDLEYSYAIDLYNVKKTDDDTEPSIHGYYSYAPDNGVLTKDKEIFGIIRSKELQTADIAKPFACLYIENGSTLSMGDPENPPIYIALTDKQANALLAYCHTDEEDEE